MTPAAENAFWYLKSVEHNDALKVLEKMPSGSFLIRLTAKSIGSFVMAYRHLGRVQNRYAKGSPQGLCFEGYDTQKFATLEALVQHYSTNQQAAIKAFKLELRLTPPKGYKPPPSVRPNPRSASLQQAPAAAPPAPTREESFGGFDDVAEVPPEPAAPPAEPAAPPVIPPRTQASQSDPWLVCTGACNPLRVPPSSSAAASFSSVRS